MEIWRGQPLNSPTCPKIHIGKEKKCILQHWEKFCFIICVGFPLSCGEKKKWITPYHPQHVESQNDHTHTNPSMNGSPSQKKVLTTQSNQSYGLYNNYSLAPIISSSKEETILLPIHFLPTCSINSYYTSMKVKMKKQITVTHSFILVEGDCKSNMDHILFLGGGGGGF